MHVHVHGWLLDRGMWLPVLRKRRQRSLDDEVDSGWPGSSGVGGVGGGLGTSGNNGGGVSGGGGGIGGGGGASFRMPTLAELNSAKAERVARFKQQTLKSFTVTFSPRLVLALYLSVALVFIPIGAAILVGSVDIRETGRIDYMQHCELGSECMVKIDVPRRIPAPSYMYYGISGMHQNHLSFVKSYSWTQLRGFVPANKDEVKDCYPELFRDANDSINIRLEDFVSHERKFNLSEIKNPCGLQADAFFNDTFELCRDAGCSRKISTTEDGIAWSSDDDRYNPNPNSPHYSKKTNLLLQDERFMVWMKLSTFAQVEKLYAIVQEPLQPGKYFLKINAEYDTRGWKGVKSFHISNTKWFGYKNSFLGFMYAITGGLCMVIAILILVLHVLNPRKPAHFESLSDMLKRELAKISIDNAQTN